MAKRFRYYFRQGWHSVIVPRANIWNWEKDSEDGFGNEAHFKALNKWCERSFGKDVWASRFRNSEGEKEFAFKEEKHANWFKLKWL